MTSLASFSFLMSLVPLLGCSGDHDSTLVKEGPAGQGGQGGSAGVGGGNTAGTGGTSGTGGAGGEPTACVAPSDPFDWPSPESVTVPAHATWKGTLEIPNDIFFSLPQGSGVDEVRWVKFVVLAKDPGKIYFQDAQAEPFHYEFATRRIPAFQGMTRAQFDAVSLANEGREAILGAVLIPADSSSNPEYAVQLVSTDDLHPEVVSSVMQTVAANVVAPAGTRAFYFPSSISRECVGGKEAELTQRGVSVGSVDRWLLGDACYAPGWAIGKLVQLPAAEVDAAYLDGRLTPDDVLLLSDTPPAELPFVAGILTLEPSTPNAHTAILARSYSVPFVYLRQADAVARAQALVGRRVVVSTSGIAGRDALGIGTVFGGCNVRFIDVEGLDASQLAEVRALAAPPAIAVTPKRASGVLSLPTDGLVPADIDRVGGKASNFGLLRAAAPENTPTPALALTFDLWDGFMDAPAPGGAAGTLRDEIARRLAPHSWPADLRSLDTTLEGIRDLIEDAPFPPALASSVQQLLGGFEPARRIRFRSSTNVEDSETFTGAGLYDSATGCLADDLDADETGPSLCNPNELLERGVLRAIQRVYSSFYFRNAYFERLRRGVDETQIGMGVLVHYSVPDPEELANGVATLTLDEFGGRGAALVTQAGAVSVTNPDGSALPEEVRIDRYEGESGTEDYLSTSQTSSLLPLGAHVMTWEADYRSFMDLFNRVADQYALVTSKVAPFALDFEYKKVAPGELSLRQVRPLPLPDTTRNVTPFLTGEPKTLCIYGSERADVFATHRLKSRLVLETGDVWLTPEELGARLLSRARVEYLDGVQTAIIEGDPATFAGASHSLDQSLDEPVVLDAWSAASGTWTLRSRVPPRATRIESPVRTLDDFYFDLSVTWAAPVPYLTYSFEEGVGFVADTRTEEAVELWGFCPEAVTPTAGFPYIEAAFEGPGDLRIQTSYWFPPPPRGATAGYTAPAIKWEQTTLTGLTTQPIVLVGYFSQTYAPNHHNFGGQYIFDPRLEPGLSASVRAELEAANVAYLIVIDQDGLEDEIWAQGIDGALRKL